MNALEYIFIPNYEETVLFITSSLEEREREETFRLKLLKNRSVRFAPQPVREMPFPSDKANHDAVERSSPNRIVLMDRA